MITYFDHAEDWNLLETERDGRKSRIDENTVGEKGISSEGLFGAVITGLFRPLTKAEIAWKETGVLGEGTVQVFSYRVAQENSNLNLRVGPMEVITVGYHGLVYIDSTTHSVRRITEVADDVPKKYPIHAASVSADYDYVSIGGQDYLMPVGAQVILKKGRHETDQNEIGFRDFHRFGSTAKILPQSPEENREAAGSAEGCLLFSTASTASMSRSGGMTFNLKLRWLRIESEFRTASPAWAVRRWSKLAARTNPPIWLLLPRLGSC